MREEGFNRFHSAMLCLFGLSLVGALAVVADRCNERETGAMRSCIEQGRHPLECEEALQR